MPVYEYVCERCGARFDRLQRYGESGPSCPTCGGLDVRKQLSIFAAGATAGAGACACGGACACRS